MLRQRCPPETSLSRHPTDRCWRAMIGVVGPSSDAVDSVPPLRGRSLSDAIAALVSDSAAEECSWFKKSIMS